MKLYITFLLLYLSFFSNNLTAQDSLPNKIIVTYSEKINLPTELLNSISESERFMFSNTHYNLSIDNTSLKSSYLLKNNNTNSFETESENKKSVTTIAEYATYKDFTNNELLIRTELFDNVYIIEKKTNPLEWKITNQKAKIGGFECMKAELKINGSIIIAYYTNQIPISEGPSTYYGLPGLIMKLESKAKNYTATHIEYTKEIKVKRFTEGKIISEKEYEEIMEEFKKKPVFHEEKNEVLKKDKNEN